MFQLQVISGFWRLPLILKWFCFRFAYFLKRIDIFLLLFIDVVLFVGFGTFYLLTYLLTYLLLTPYSRVLLEKLTGSAASQEIPRIFRTRRFITVLTSARHLSLSSANSIQSLQAPPTS